MVGSPRQKDAGKGVASPRQDYLLGSGGGARGLCGSTMPSLPNVSGKGGLKGGGPGRRRHNPREKEQ
ncbi:hypothetical protein E2C01_056924 [Portunus trituberculatus]|uniref:Uncharacterized protein n=1 Tax=Portunus trituberculatus TaxID=210409 RepID=A0A5B7GYP9_PORTR|nr:hypothetical protein [Portunus trituberculatus]